MKTTRLFIIITCLMLSVCSARTWTSADGSKTFEGEFRSYNPTTGEVAVVMNGTLVKFNKDVLSEADIKFVGEAQQSKSSNSSPQEAILEELAKQKVGAVVAKAKLHRLEGKRFTKAAIEQVPEYYLLYYSASW